MKRILIIVMIIFNLFIKNTYAETIYGEYKKVDELSKQFEDEIKIDSYKIYNTYTKEYIDMGYMKDNELYIKDENDYIIEETFTNEYKESDEYITINFDYLCKVRTLFLLTDIKDLELTELEVFYKGEKIDYTIENITNDKTNYLYDNNLDTIYKHNSSTYISLAFSNGLLLKDTKIIMHTKKGINSSFTLYMGHRPNIILNNNTDKKHIISFNIVTETDEIDKKVEYFYKDEIKLYKHYEEIKKPQNIYVKEGDNLLLNDYKIINEYYERDKLVLKDNLIINNKNQTINDLIEYASSEVKIECDINYQINDKYNCKFILNDINLTKDIYINIKENVVEKNEEIKKELEQSKDSEIKKESEQKKDNEIIKDNNIKTEIKAEMKNIIEVDKNIEIKNTKPETTVKIKNKKNNIKSKEKNIKKENKNINNSETHIEDKLKIDNNNEKKDIVLLNNKIKNESTNDKDKKIIIKIIKVSLFILAFFISVLLKKKKKKK